jgi:uncharacterized membrane protein
VRQRLVAAVLVGSAAYVVLPSDWVTGVRCLVAWDIGAVVYLGWTIHIMFTRNPDIIRIQAARQDESAAVILIIILLAIAASFVSIAGILSGVRSAAVDSKAMHLVLAGMTILLSWILTQVVFTMHYAHEYYRPEAENCPEGGLRFPGDDKPDYWDFFYFATSIGAASQTSDVSITNKPLRRLVAFHAVISFFFNAAVLALAINLAAGVVN